MNSTISDFSKQKIKECLEQCTPDQQRMFRWMYGRAKGKRSLEDAESLTTDEVIAEVPEEKLEWALTQIENTLAKVK